MRKSLNILAAALVVIAFGTAAVFAADVAQAGGHPGVININTADAEQLALLPRIGPKAGARIVEYRNQHGPFKTTVDLMQVKGIGDKTFELLSSYLVVEGKSTLTTEVRAPRRPRASKKASNTAQ